MTQEADIQPPVRDGVFEDSSADSKAQRLWKRIQGHGAVVILSGFVGIIVGAGGVADSLSKIHLFLHPEPTPLMLSKNDAKSEFSRHLTQEAWGRLFWARTYAKRVDLAAPPTDIEYSWTKYEETTDDWNRNLMTNYLGLRDYYPNEGKDQTFLFEIQDKFKDIHTMLVAIRYPQGGKVNSGNAAPELEKTLDSLNTDLFVLVTLKPEPEPQKKKGLP